MDHSTLVPAVFFFYFARSIFPSPSLICTALFTNLSSAGTFAPQCGRSCVLGSYTTSFVPRASSGRTYLYFKLAALFFAHLPPSPTNTHHCLPSVLSAAFLPRLPLHPKILILTIPVLTTFFAFFFFPRHRFLFCHLPLCSLLHRSLPEERWDC